ncbi:hypothetical protein OMAG_002272, partial [Candidatus Omnitrophus magneticus]
ALYNFLCLKWLSRNERKIKDPILLYKKMGSKKNWQTVKIKKIPLKKF